MDDGRIGPIADGGQETHQPAKAIAEDSNLACAAAQLGHNACRILLRLWRWRLGRRLIDAEAVLPVGLGSDAEVDPSHTSPS